MSGRSWARKNCPWNAQRKFSHCAPENSVLASSSAKASRAGSATPGPRVRARKSATNTAAMHAARRTLTASRKPPAPPKSVKSIQNNARASTMRCSWCCAHQIDGSPSASRR